MFIILTGSSGVGKNTVIKSLEKENPNFKLVPTYTTRNKRDTEIEGNPYYFITKEEFQQKIKDNELIEHEYIHTNYYGSSYKIFDDLINQNKILIKDIGIEGAQNLEQKLNDRTEIVKIFLTTKSKKDLKQRLKGRGEKEIKLRLKRYKREQAERNKFDYLIFNKDLNETTKIINSISQLDFYDIIPSKPVGKLNLNKIKRYNNKLLKGYILKPIKVALNEDKIFILDGEEKFIAGLLANKTVCKEICLKDVKNNLTVEQLMEWKSLVRESSEN